MKYIISVNNDEDFVKKTGLGETWTYSDRKNATKFNTIKQAKEYAGRMPKNLPLNVVIQ